MSLFVLILHVSEALSHRLYSLPGMRLDEMLSSSQPVSLYLLVQYSFIHSEQYREPLQRERFALEISPEHHLQKYYTR